MSVTVTAAAATHLVFTTPPPDPIVAGQAFTVVVAAEDTYGNVDASFDGSVTITLPGQPRDDRHGASHGRRGDVRQPHARRDLTGWLDPGWRRRVDRRIDGPRFGQRRLDPRVAAAARTAGQRLLPTPPTPTITGEQVVMFRKTNKKGKPVGKAVLQGFTLEFSTAMNAATAGSAANYRMTATSTKHAKKKTIPPPTPVAFTAAYNAATNAVTLTLAGKQAFAKGGQITVSYGAVTSASGDSLDSSDATFTIAPKGTSVTPG